MSLVAINDMRCKDESHSSAICKKLLQLCSKNMLGSRISRTGLGHVKLMHMSSTLCANIINKQHPKFASWCWTPVCIGTIGRHHTYITSATANARSQDAIAKARTNTSYKSFLWLAFEVKNAQWQVLQFNYEQKKKLATNYRSFLVPQFSVTNCFSNSMMVHSAASSSRSQ